MKDMKNLSTQPKKFSVDSKTHTSGTTECPDYLIVLGPKSLILKGKICMSKWSTGHDSTYDDSTYDEIPLMTFFWGEHNFFTIICI